MNSLSDKKVFYVCFTHVELVYNYPNFVKTIHMGDSQKVDRLNIKDLSPEWQLFHSIIGGTAGSFALKKLLLNSSNDFTHIGICQYRKFITTEKIGRQAENYKVMDLISNKDLKSLDLNNIIIPKNSEFLVTKPGLFTLNNINHGYLYQYKDVHFIEDLLRFTAIAVEVNALDRNEVCDFFNETIFIPGGIELGVMPLNFWIKHITLMEIIVKRCLEEHAYRREGSQARSWAFCCERLGSYFLLKEFRAKENKGLDWIEKHTGFLNLIVEEGCDNYTPGR